MKAFFIKIWTELKFWYQTIKTFIVKALAVLDAPNVSPARISSKRIVALGSFIVSIRQLAIGDRFGTVVLLATAIVLLVIAAITKS